ncbi:hypothetical protein [Streptomyces sp. NPDC053728]|uniref:hypothetical protein n=1 Tax=Streptomyces sp. NPDC053728 TaxID=3155534 RepID=UPI0034374EED
MSHEGQPLTATDQLAWRQHIPALASAAAGIRQASDARDSVSDSFCDEDGWPIDEKGYADGKVTVTQMPGNMSRSSSPTAPEVLAGVRAAAHGADYVEGPVSEDLRQLPGIGTTLERAGQVRHEWDQVMALMNDSLPGSREIYASHDQGIRNSEGWHYADELPLQGSALARAASYLAEQADPDRPSQNDRAQAALARSALGNREASPASPPAPPASNPKLRHSR